MLELKNLTIVLILTSGLFITNCSEKENFEKDCQLCKKIELHKIKTILQNFIYNEISDSSISKKAKIQLNQAKETLRGGHKFINCGCRNNTVCYQLWCANDKTFELHVVLNKDGDFTIIGLVEEEFSHP